MHTIRRSHLTTGLLAAAFLSAAIGCGADRPSAVAIPWVAESAVMTGADAATIDAPFGGSDDPDSIPVQWLVPWDEGFLAIAVRYPARLPDQLPPEIADFFPPEVVALFPDELPPTQQEAIEILEGAGLLDDVMTVLDEHPAAMDAVQPVPLPVPEMVGSWSAGGDAWTATNIALPDGIGEISQVVAAGDRLVIAAAATPTEDSDPVTVTIASTVDLQTWRATSFDIATADRLRSFEWPPSITATGDDEHWVADVIIDATTDEIERWSGSWDGESVMVSADTAPATLLTTSAGFLAMDDWVTFSPDGQTWTEVATTMPIDHIRQATVIGDEVVAIAETISGTTSIYLTDATGTSWTEVEVPGLEDTFAVWNRPSGPAFIVTSEPLAFEADGFSQADFGLLATDDGRTWLLEDLDEGDPDERISPHLATANGPTVLVGTEVFGWIPYSGDWYRFTMTD